MRSARIVFLALSLTAATAHADGFLFDGQNARCMGVANACVTQGDDATALAFNPAALAHVRRTTFTFGGTMSGIVNGHFRGHEPGFAEHTTAELRPKTQMLPLGYAAMPLGSRVTVGIGAYSMFRQQTEWTSPASFVGRFIATRSAIDSYDISPAVGVEITPNLTAGASLIYRTSKVSAARIEGTSELSMATDAGRSTGWMVGTTYKPWRYFTLALTHRSPTETNLRGKGGVGTAEVPLTSRLSFPAQTVFGVAWNPSDKLVVEGDAVFTSWQRVKAIDFHFDGHPELDTHYPLDLHESRSGRLGFRHLTHWGWQWHFGYAAERSAQNDATVGPFFHDAYRSTYGIGIAHHGIDLALSWSTDTWLDVHENVDGINGTYRRNAWIVGLTFTR